MPVTTPASTSPDFQPDSNARRFAKEVRDGDAIEQVFRLSQRQLRVNAKGEHYLQMQLADKTGSLNAMQWNVKESVIQELDSGDFVHVKGRAQIFKGAIQIIVQKIRRAKPAEVCDDDFESLSQTQRLESIEKLKTLFQSLKNVYLRELAAVFCEDPQFLDDFSSAPAAIRNHHAYAGGLIAHTTAMMEMAGWLGPRYEGIDTDVLLMGTFLHDIGKTRELMYGAELSYTDHGQLLGHMTIGCDLLDQAITKAEGRLSETFPDDLRIALKHIILSHHGFREYGSTVLPMTLEAMLIHHIDMLDSKMNFAIESVSTDVNTDSRWTTFLPSIDRKIYKPQ